jgi:hypothetical protein
MIAARYPEGVVKCPQCGRTDVSYLAKQNRYKCYGKHPKPQFSLKVGTIMEDSPLGLDKWLCAIWLIANAKNGISSYEIHRGLGITQKSAWFMLHRIRLAMQNGSLEKLSGHVEVDETFIGGLARNMHRSDKPRRIHSTGGSGKVAVMAYSNVTAKSGLLLYLECDAPNFITKSTLTLKPDRRCTRMRFALTKNFKTLTLTM